MGFVIVTDSATDVPKWLIEEFSLHVIPTPVVINEVDYFDGDTILPEAFYDILRKGTDVKTYHINSHMFHENFEPYAKRGEEVVYVCFSTGIAGTFNAANIAKQELLEEYPGFDLTIIDSRCASVGFGTMVYYALLMQKNGADKKTVIEAIEWHRDHMRAVFTVETLEYLYKGGRLSRTSAIAGSVLDIKPIIRVDEKGALVAIEKVRGRHKSLKRLVDLVGIWGDSLDEQTVGLVDGDDKATAAQVKQKLTEQYGCSDFMENYVGCAIGAHTGPGIIGITFLSEKSPYTKYLTRKKHG